MRRPVIPEGLARSNGPSVGLLVGKLGAMTSWLMAAFCVTACSKAPAQDVLGSFFPAWLLCAAIGVVGSVMCQKVLAVIGLGNVIPVPTLTYLALACAITLAVWLAWFGG